MEKQFYSSPFKNYKTASSKKVFLGALCDYGFIFILTMLVFSFIALPVFSALPLTKENKAAIKEETIALKETVSESRLQPYDSESGELSTLTALAKEYVLCLTKTSYFLNDEPFPINDTEKEAVNKDETFLKDDIYSNDRISYYYYVFKAEHASLNSYVYDSIDYKDKKEDYLYLSAFNYQKSDYSSFFSEKTPDLPKYQQLEISKAKIVAEYLVYGDTGGLSSYISLQKAYLSASDVFIKEVENKYEPYLEHEAIFERVYQRYSLSYILSTIVAYLFSLALYELFPLVSKRKTTLGYHLHKLAYSSESNTVPSFWRYFLKSVLRMIVYCSIPLLLLFFFSQSGLLFVSFGYFRFIMLVAFSFALLLLSIILIFSKENHQPIEEFCARLVIVDTQELEDAVPLEERKAAEDGK